MKTTKKEWMNKLAQSIRCFIMLLLLVVPQQSAWAQNIGKPANDNFVHEEHLQSFFEKLEKLQNGKLEKINIVHIGDSHIQADFFTDVIRQNLQGQFGNGGYGFTFPYSIAKTNGTKLVKYNSNTVWNTSRNIDRNSNVQLGLGGIGLFTNDTSFYLNIYVDPLYQFNTIKIFHPSGNNCFKLATSTSEINTTSSAPAVAISKSAQPIYHKIKAGETLYRLSAKYKVSVESIKKTNNLKSNTIQLGQNIKIPQKSTARTQVVPAKTSEIIAIDTLQITQKNLYYTEYTTTEAITGLTILPDKVYQEYTINGLFLESDVPGVIYSSIGINGAKASDFNKHSLFFEQLASLNPDLVILSFGTNESFGKLPTNNYIVQMQEMINNIRSQHPNTSVLIMTPPPSFLRRRLANNLLPEYTDAVIKMKDCTIWNLFSKMGGLYAPAKKGNPLFIAKDKVHYTKEGYQMQGEMFSSDLLSTYDNYINSNKEQ